MGCGELGRLWTFQIVDSVAIPAAREVFYFFLRHLALATKSGKPKAVTADLRCGTEAAAILRNRNGDVQIKAAWRRW